MGYYNYPYANYEREESERDRKIRNLRANGYDVDEAGHFYHNNDPTRLCGYYVDSDGKINSDM